MKSDDFDFMAEAKAEMERERAELSGALQEPDEELYQRLDAERPCPRCAGLERKEIAAVNEIRRLLLSRSEARVERDSARALLRELAAAAQGYLDVVCDWIDASDERAHLEAVLRRVESEAGGEKTMSVKINRCPHCHDDNVGVDFRPGFLLRRAGLWWRCFYCETWLCPAREWWE